jgi:hypothetical protein
MFGYKLRVSQVWENFGQGIPLRRASRIGAEMLPQITQELSL